MAIAGKICNASFVAKISNVAKEDAYIVKLLKNAGAIIHLRTNQPQSLMVSLTHISDIFTTYLTNVIDSISTHATISQAKL